MSKIDGHTAQYAFPGMIDLPEVGKDREREKRWSFSFHDSPHYDVALLGRKGAGLAEMTSIGIPVPPGFTITTEACREYQNTGKFPAGLLQEVRSSIKALELSTGRKFGNARNPLLVSVRSGASVSMPGMMDTILNLGINEDVAEGISTLTGLPSFALDTYRRFVEMFGKVAMGVTTDILDEVSSGFRREHGISTDSQIPDSKLADLILVYQKTIEGATGKPFPKDPHTQLEMAIKAVFESWNGRRAVDYRNYHGLDHTLGTAVSIVSMVFGNTDNESCTGVLFTRHPASGENRLYGEYLVNAQGEDVVSGSATPVDLARLADHMPHVYKKLEHFATALENHYSDAQDIEFTVESGDLYILQTRSAKRSPRAAVKIAVDMANSGLITKHEALLRIEPDHLFQLMLPVIDPVIRDKALADGRLLGTGIGASQGAAKGPIVFTADAAVYARQKGDSPILVRPETSPDDIHGILAAEGIITMRGGATSHAAVVARGLGKPCITGAEHLEINTKTGNIRHNDQIITSLEWLTIDGGTGEVFVGDLETISPRPSDNLDMNKLLIWADETRRLEVWANADSPTDAAKAIELGAEGIGLCRTEHMFLEPNRLVLMRDLIISAHFSGKSDDQESKLLYERALTSLEDLQVTDFEAILRTMGQRPVVIRLLDPPLHEFLPDSVELEAELTVLETKGSTAEEISQKKQTIKTVKDLQEVNPMLGMRGSRLGLMHPSIYEMQVRAIVRATISVSNQAIKPNPEIMLPLISDVGEMHLLRERLQNVIELVSEDSESVSDYKIGTMIELPRAAVTADKIADFADFFSFGTNDLTQTTYGFSRDDAESKFLMQYLRDGVLTEDPFQVLDRDGVGRLVRMGYSLGKEKNPELQIGVCGEHGGDPSSIEFFDSVGLDYVSCSPYRVPIARLSAAQAVIRSNEQ